MSLFIERVKARAIRLGLSQDEVARRADFRERTFDQYLTRDSEPKFAGLLRICDALVIHPNYLWGVNRRSRTTAEARHRQASIASCGDGDVA